MSKMVKLTLGYLGEKYNGWQIQKGQAHTKTIQGELQRAIRTLTGEEVQMTAAGRTDAGVHAFGQVAAFLTQSTVPANRFPDALNCILPDDIIIYRGELAAKGFHATKDAVGKWYRYIYYLGEQPHVFFNKVAYKVHGLLDIEAMCQAAPLLEGEHNFKSFCSVNSLAKNHVRNVRQCQVKKDGDFLYLDIYADGFLYNMVRIIAGTLLSIGRKKMNAFEIPQIIEGRSRFLAGSTAPAKGLTLIRVDYQKPDQFFSKADSLDMPSLFY